MPAYSFRMHYLARIANREEGDRLRKSLAFWRTHQKFCRLALARIGTDDDEALNHERNRAGAVTAASKILRLNALLTAITRRIKQGMTALRAILTAISEPQLIAVLPVPKRDPVARKYAAHGPPCERSPRPFLGP